VSSVILYIVVVLGVTIASYSALVKETVFDIASAQVIQVTSLKTDKGFQLLISSIVFNAF